jgi:hypothetical protein
MTVSKEIAEAPCVIFLGAGASKVVGLMLMKEFVDSRHDFSTFLTETPSMTNGGSGVGSCCLIYLLGL